MPELGALLTLEYGEAMPAEARSGHGYPVFGSNGEVGRHRDFLVPESGIIVGRKGSAGKVTWSNGPFWPIDTTYWVKCAPEDRRWIYWVLNWLPLARLDSSTGIPGLNRNDVYALSVDRPSLNERKKIVEILDAVEAIIQKTEALIDNLKAIKQGLLHDLLTRGIDANGQLRPPQAEVPHLYKESPWGLVPNQWRLGALQSWLSGKPKNGYSPKEAARWTGVQMLGLGCLTSNGFEPVQLKPAPCGDGRLATASLTAGDLLMSRANTRDLVGLVGIYRDVGTPCTYPDLMMRLQPLPDTSSEFLQLVLQSPRVRRQIQARAVGTSASMVKISGKVVCELEVAMPCKHEQERILRCLAANDEHLRTEVKTLASMRDLKSALMDDLLTGRVRVTPLLATQQAERST